MSLFHLVITGLLQSRLRFAMCSLSFAAAVAGLTIVRSVGDVWRGAVASAAEDRLIVRSAVPSGEPLPLDYIVKARNVEPEIRTIAARWLCDMDGDGLAPRRVAVTADVEDRSTAADPGSPRTVRASARALTALGLQSGQRVRLRRHGLREERVVQVDEQAASAGLVLYAEGFAGLHDNADEIAIDVSNAGIAPEVARRLDRLFAEQRVPTLTQSARAATRALERSLHDVFRFIDVLSAAILLIIAFVVALSMAFATRERTTDYAVLRALGFAPSAIVLLVAAETLLVCATGTVVGASIAALGATFLGTLLRQVMPGISTIDVFSFSALAVSVVSASALSVLAAMIPALGASRVEAAQALRAQEG